MNQKEQIINGIVYVEVHGCLYQKDCPDCKGTGCVFTKIFDPPEQCDCGQFDPPENENGI